MNESSTYQITNKSFKKRCIYRIGHEVSFFNEINHMISAMLYCLENELKFELHSDQSGVCDDIWKDFFNPFTSHSSDPYHFLYNRRPDSERLPHQFTVDELFQIKKTLANCFLTQDIWPYIKHKYKYVSNHYIRSTYMSGTPLAIACKLIKDIWIYKPQTHNKINKILETLKIDRPYVGIHIMGGNIDWINTRSSIKTSFDQVNSITNDANLPVFIATDDNKILDRIKAAFPKREILNFNFPDRSGWKPEEFLHGKTKESQRNAIIQLLADVQMLVESEFFIDCAHSNIGQFVRVARNNFGCLENDSIESHIYLKAPSVS